MPLQYAILMDRTRIGLAVLGLLLIASITWRISIYRHPSVTSVTAAGTMIDASVDLGDGVLLPRADALHRSMPLPGCLAPASINFVEAHPYASDPSLAGAPRPGDRVAYVYHGWHLESRFATTGLNAIYFARRAQDRIAIKNSRFIDNIAVKIIIPENCTASPEDVMVALRHQVRAEL